MQRPQGLATHPVRTSRVCRCARRVVVTATFLSAQWLRDMDAYRMGGQLLIRKDQPAPYISCSSASVIDHLNVSEEIL